MFQGQMAPVGLILLVAAAVIGLPLLGGAIKIITEIGKAMGL
jgi:hypothetical protein